MDVPLVVVLEIRVLLVVVFIFDTVRIPILVINLVLPDDVFDDVVFRVVFAFDDG